MSRDWSRVSQFPAELTTGPTAHGDFRGHEALMAFFQDVMRAYMAASDDDSRIEGMVVGAVYTTTIDGQEHRCARSTIVAGGRPDGSPPIYTEAEEAALQGIAAQLRGLTDIAVDRMLEAHRRDQDNKRAFAKAKPVPGRSIDTSSTIKVL